ncbi:PqqD family protein [Kitasatospora sp. NPDC056651]|uniref:PqqD family protein n=1 Tax=Kitasatospora sp. NPDC056651 TaxID=3345892 RepID=UPI0036B50E92
MAARPGGCFGAVGGDVLSAAPHVRHATIGGRTAILDIRTGNWVMLNPAASRIWQAIVHRGGVEGLADEIAIELGADPAVVRQRIAAAISGMVERGLFTDPSTPPPRRRWWRRTGGSR